MSLLALEAVTVRRGPCPVVDGVSARIGEGELVGLIGPNGAGKTTLMRAALGLIRAEGAIALGGTPLAAQLAPRERALRAAYLPQDREIAWPVRVETLVGLGRTPHLPPGRAPGPADRAAVEAALDRMDLAGFRDRPATALSGGERARALIARALAQEAPLLVADEPAAGLDPAHQLQLMALLREMAAAGRGVVVSLHDLGLAARWCDRLLLMHQGRLVAEGPPGSRADRRTPRRGLRHHRASRPRRARPADPAHRPRRPLNPVRPRSSLRRDRDRRRTMQTARLGTSDLVVSRYCLGTMTWGTQNTEAEAHAQIDYALDRGINFLDTAEMYPTTPLARERAGETERIIGTWLKKTGRRGDVVIATKITGEGSHVVRDGAPIGPENLRIALEGSLKRLQTDVIDLYQLHWPNRGSYHFRRSWTYAPEKQPRGLDAEFLAILETLDGFVKAGKVRAIGLSNETAWGTARFLHLAEVARPAARRLDPERIQPDAPAVRPRPRRALPSGTGRAPGLFAARRRASDRQVRGRRPSGGLARVDQRQSRRPHLGAFRACRRGLCRARAETRPRPGADGARLRGVAPVHGLGDHRRHDDGPARHRHRRRRSDPAGGGDGGHCRHPPPPSDPDVGRVSSGAAAAGFPRRRR
jgi:iron complex transport system ATP-binding protein